ncbi:MAG: DUF5698 domain-containing protein [Bacilli bacterium]
MTIFLLCIKIFFVRIIDVSLSTFRMVLTVKGKRFFAMVISFFSTLIWFLIIKEALNTKETSLWIAFSYSAGYALGTFIGSLLSNYFIRSKILVQAIINNDNLSVVDNIRKAGYAVSTTECNGKNTTKKLMLFIEVDNKNLNELKKLIKNIDENAFIVVNETKYVENGFFK